MSVNSRKGNTIILSDPTHNNENTQSVLDELQPLNNSDRSSGRQKATNLRPLSKFHSLAATMDRYHLTQILFYAFGTLSQVSSSFFITANDYWNYKFRNTSEPYNRSADTSALQSQFFSTYSLISHVCGIGAIVVAMATAKYIKEVTRVAYSLIAMIVLFVITIIFVNIDTDDWQNIFLVITLISGGFLSVFGNVFMITSFTISSKFPPKYLAVQLSGQAISGIAAALLQIISLASGLKSTGVAIIYFVVGLVCICSTLVLFFGLWKYSDFFNQYLNAVQEVPKNIGSMFGSVFMKVKGHLAVMILIMGPTVAIHPSITSLVKSTESGTDWGDLYFIPVSTFLLYYVFDLIGREMSRWLKWPDNIYILITISVLRIGLVPMIIYCNIQPPRHHLPVLFDSDIAYIFFIILFAFTNGYLFNLCILQIPMLTEPSEKPIAGLVIVIVMIASLGACSFLNLLIVKLI